MAKRGRPTKEEELRKATKDALIKDLQEKRCTGKYYMDQVEEYMNYYDNLALLNRYLLEGFKIEILKEKRQVTKEMRSILAYLGFKPDAYTGGDESEEL